MGKHIILPKSRDILDAFDDTCEFRINVDILNECFGAGESLYMQAAYPRKNAPQLKGKNPADTFFVWMPKLYSNNSKWKNSLEENGDLITEIAEPTLDIDWKDQGKHLIDAYRIVFTKESHKSWYKFQGVYKTEKMDHLDHSYRRIATKIKLIGNPVHTIEIVSDGEAQVELDTVLDRQDDIQLQESMNITPFVVVGAESYVPVPEPVKKNETTEKKVVYKRDPEQSMIALKRSHFTCELNPEHKSFTRKSNGTRYMEPHHLVPMSAQQWFSNSLDVPANIVSLCSNCHNLIHYGKDQDAAIAMLYEKRKEELKAAGINISCDHIKKYY